MVRCLRYRVVQPADEGREVEDRKSRCGLNSVRVGRHIAALQKDGACVRSFLENLKGFADDLILYLSVVKFSAAFKDA